ncbi:GNAT family N-acetyltransferase [Pseudonocardia abyssalis]|uniref:GNAT family N-acetyltransferase n=1 Tax=Pseudonocardia abyssalis TaxID=2792008 RepID=A0ABS6UZ95_9PSEU|nr:GNAT family N-acetyltransferase [Pseudonocardia abyssalis]MBW0116618.1 GNAT family N-acetyltransferase [Pseudonocardia abyssalis]MBW0137532.1 GNAT family N-acetyltransferase [Pseudonocardia abyssalis]
MLDLRRARAGEAAELAALAVRSKGHWPYPPEFLARFARVQGLSEEVVAANEVWVGERDGVVRCFCTLLHRAGRTILDDLWLDPAEIGRGSGRLLFEHAVARAVAAGARVLEWDADPYAVGFYERMGAVTVGWSDSPLGRPLPQMRLPLDG